MPTIAAVPLRSRRLEAIAALLTMAALAWAVVILAVPVRLAAGGDGLAAAAVYAAGSAVCHQRPERSFQLSGVRMPVCARCTGLYLAGAVGLLAGWGGRPREPARRARLPLVLALAPVAISVALEWAGLGTPSNVVRAATGVPAGAVAGWIVVRLLRGAGRAMRYDPPS